MRRRRQAAVANQWAPPPVPTVAEDPLVADDVDELDVNDEPVAELHETGSGEDEPGTAKDEDVLCRAEDDPDEAPYEQLDEDGDFDDDDTTVPDRSPLLAAEPAPAGKPQKRGQACRRAKAGADSAATAPDVGTAGAAAAAAPVVKLPASVAPGTAKVAAKRTKKALTIVPEEPMAELLYLFYDIETTSNNKKQYDRIIELAMIAYDGGGVELGRWERRFSNCNAPAAACK